MTHTQVGRASHNHHNRWKTTKKKKEKKLEKTEEGFSMVFGWVP